MQYNSSLAQLALIAAILVSTTMLNHILNAFILDEFIINENTGYTRDVTIGIVSCICGFLGALIVNLIGVRFTLLICTLTNLFYGVALVVKYHHSAAVYIKVAQVVYCIGYSFSRVAILSAVLSYSSERWKSRAVAVILVLEYVSMMMGNIIVLKHINSSGIQHLHAAIVYLAVAALVPLLNVMIVPTDQVVRNDGVYIVSPQTSYLSELKQMAGMLRSKYMLLFIPYMFFYPWAFGTIGNVPTKDANHVYCFNGGKILVLLLGQMLDVSWTGRRARTTIGLAALTAVFVISFAITCYLIDFPYDWSVVPPNLSTELHYEYIDRMVHQQAGKSMLAAAFFGGAASGFIELFAYWVIGSLTNDFKTSVRFVGAFHSIVAIGGTMGYQIANKINNKKRGCQLFYVLASFTIASFGLMYILVRWITETNDWSLENIKSENTDEMTEKYTLGTSSIENSIRDIKYHHSQRF